MTLTLLRSRGLFHPRPTSPCGMTAACGRVSAASWKIGARAAGIALLAVLLLALVSRACPAQVEAVVSLASGQGETFVRNPSATPLRVTIALVRDTATEDHVGRPVRALVSPPAFSLGPGELQRVRLKLREPIPAGALLRLVTTLTPADADQPAPGSDTRPVARLIVVERLVSRVRVE